MSIRRIELILLTMSDSIIATHCNSLLTESFADLSCMSYRLKRVKT